MGNKKIICIVGPTAVGKTSLSIHIAKKIKGEVISADSRQVYTGLDIGTGKVTSEEAQGIPHHLIDVADPRAVFSASDYVKKGTEAIANIYSRGAVPLIVGGTGFYIDALLGKVGLAEVPPNPALRARLEKEPLAELQRTLQEKDPERFETIDTQNPRRLVRALEIVDALGKTPPPLNTSPYAVLWIGLRLPQEALYEKIHRRLIERFENEQMLDEARSLHEKGLSYERMEELGLEYRFMARHLQGLLSYADMVLELEKEIIAYAKRQMTWFNKNKEIQWFTPDEKKKITETVKKSLI